MLILTFITNVLTATVFLLSGVMREKIGLFVFGIGLIVSAIVLRRIFSRNERQEAEKTIS